MLRLVTAMLLTFCSVVLADDVPAQKPAAPRFGGTKAGQVRDDNSLKMKLVWCPPGQFMMGSPEGEKDRSDNENQVQVTLTKGFWLGQHEVTQAEWRRVIQTTPWSGQQFVEQGDNYPATFVSWFDAMKYCEKLTEREHSAGRVPSDSRYTLPTEAQWEYACRAGVKSAFSFGDDELDTRDYAWFTWNADNGGEKYAHSVGQKKANPWGLYDMHGNVWEWCRDIYVKGLPGGTNPEVAAGASGRVARGGCWFSAAYGCRSAFRGGGGGFLPSNRGNAAGFRVALEQSGK